MERFELPEEIQLEIRQSEDVVRVRHAVRTFTSTLGFNLVDQTKVVTAASEIARNTLDYGGGGTARLETVHNGIRVGIRMTFEDQGPGIADVGLALKDGFTTGSGLGLGLSGAKRLCNDFEITSKPGEGTRVVLVKWKA